MNAYTDVPTIDSATTDAFKVILLITVHDHVPALRSVVARCLELGYPVMVVDDGSTDDALHSVNDLPIFRHRLPKNRGKGAALQAGAAVVEKLGYTAVITLDADGQHDPADAKQLIDTANLSWPAIVIGVRSMDGESVPMASRFGMTFSNFCVRLECGKTLPDTLSGFHLYPTAHLTRRFLSRRYAFDIEVLVRGAWAGLEILATPISVRYPSKEERTSRFRNIWNNFHLVGLHTWLIMLALLPWHHRRAASPAEKSDIPSLLHPVRFLRQLCVEHSSPGELATAVWLGIFIGAMPIIPFGIAAIVYVCHRLQLNKLVGAGASNVCVAPFVPFLCIEVGHYMRYGEWWTTFNWQTLVEEIHLRLFEWLLGAFPVGAILGTVGALLTYGLIRTFRAR